MQVQVLGDILKSNKIGNHNVINVNIKNNDNNVNSPYAFDENKTKLNTPEHDLAFQIANEFDDLKNFAFYLSKAKKIGCMEMDRLFRAVKEEIKERKNSRYSIRSNPKYFAWKVGCLLKKS